MFIMKMGNCDFLEAHTRIGVYVQHALDNGAQNIQVRTCDTDVVVILVGIWHKFTAKEPLAQVWVAFGKGSAFQYFSIDGICKHLDLTNVPFDNGMRHGIKLPRKGKKIRLEHVESIS